MVGSESRVILRGKKSMTEAGRQAPQGVMWEQPVEATLCIEITAVTPSQDDRYEVNDRFVGLKVPAP